MEHSTEVEYISVYERPKRGNGKPSGSKYTPEEIRQRKIETAKNI